MSLETNNPLEENKEENIYIISLNLLNDLKKLDSLEQARDIINSENKKLYKLAGSNKLTVEQILVFISGLQYYKNKGGKIMFSGEFDNNLMDVIGGEVSDLKIENMKSKSRVYYGGWYFKNGGSRC